MGPRLRAARAARGRRTHSSLTTLCVASLFGSFLPDWTPPQMAGVLFRRPGAHKYQLIGIRWRSRATVRASAQPQSLALRSSRTPARIWILAKGHQQPVRLCFRNSHRASSGEVPCFHRGRSGGGGADRDLRFGQCCVEIRLYFKPRLLRPCVSRCRYFAVDDRGRRASLETSHAGNVLDRFAVPGRRRLFPCQRRVQHQVGLTGCGMGNLRQVDPDQFAREQPAWL